MLRVYIAAPYLDAARVRRLGGELKALSLDVLATWAADASGPEALDTLPVEEVRRIALVNDRELLSAHLVVALAREGAGAEMFAEVRLALAHRIPVLWIGARKPLSAYRPGVLRVDSPFEGKTFLSGVASILAELRPFETRLARETLWDLIECFDAAEAPPRSGPRARSVG